TSRPCWHCGLEGLAGPDRRFDPGPRRVAGCDRRRRRRMTVTPEISPDQEALREAFGAFFAKESPPEVVRAAEPLGFDAALWARLSGLGVPDLACGGQTALADLSVLAEEF